MHDVRLNVANRCSQPVSLVLEPAGEVYLLAPGETRGLRYVGDPTPSLSIEVGDAEIKVWEEGSGVLEIDSSQPQ